MRTLLNYSRLPKRQLDSIPFHSIQVESIRFDLIPFESNTLSQYQWLIYESMHKQRTRVVYVFPAPLYYIIDICALVFVLHWIKLNQHLIKCTENKATAISMGMCGDERGGWAVESDFVDYVNQLCSEIKTRIFFYPPISFLLINRNRSLALFSVFLVSFLPSVFFIFIFFCVFYWRLSLVMFFI